MAAPTGDAFDVWLGEKLQKINPDVDLEVFVTYIRGVLETDEDEEDTDESISGILGEITEDGLEELCVAIRAKWAELNKALIEEKEKKETMNIDQQLASIMEKANVTVVKQKEQSEEERARKAAILAQYAQVSDGEETDEEGATGGGGGGSGGGGGGDDLERICNAEAVGAREKEMRDRSKQESEQKKAKDKEDREKQKQKALDRKEKEKARTQKGERRR